MPVRTGFAYCPHVAGRYRCHTKKQTAIRPDIAAWYFRPGCAVPVCYECAYLRGGEAIPDMSDRPDVVRRQGRYSFKVPTCAGIGRRNRTPYAAVPMLDQRIPARKAHM